MLSNYVDIITGTRKNHQELMRNDTQKTILF